MGDLRSQLSLAAVAAILGLLIVVQLHGQAGGSELQSKTAQELTSIVANQNTENDRLRAEVSSLQIQLAELKADRANGATSVDQLEAELGRIRAWSGLHPIPGAALNIPVRGDIHAAADEDPRSAVHTAGAAAIAVGDVRVVTRTSVGGVPGSLDVDGFLLRDPFTIEAIGKPETLVGSLTRVGGIIAQLSATTPSATVDVQPVDKLMTLPATKRNLVPDHGHPGL